MPQLSPRGECEWQAAGCQAAANVERCEAADTAIP
jgi:hypothetical protein